MKKQFLFSLVIIASALFIGCGSHSNELGESDFPNTEADSINAFIDSMARAIETEKEFYDTKVELVESGYTEREADSIAKGIFYKGK